METSYKGVGIQIKDKSKGDIPDIVTYLKINGKDIGVYKDIPITNIRVHISRLQKLIDWAKNQPESRVEEIKFLLDQYQIQDQRGIGKKNGPRTDSLNNWLGGNEAKTLYFKKFDYLGKIAPCDRALLRLIWLGFPYYYKQPGCGESYSDIRFIPTAKTFVALRRGKK